VFYSHEQCLSAQILRSASFSTRAVCVCVVIQPSPTQMQRNIRPWCVSIFRFRNSETRTGEISSHTHIPQCSAELRHSANQRESTHTHTHIPAARKTCSRVTHINMPPHNQTSVTGLFCNNSLLYSQTKMQSCFPSHTHTRSTLTGLNNSSALYNIILLIIIYSQA